MQIVIDIPKKWFNYMVREDFTEVNELCAVIQHGTILPKGHGRLIDADDIDNHIIGHVDTRSCPTIIEADKEVDNG
jgi:hypothetical protein